MRILVFADSHTDVDTMELVFSKVHADMVIHLGDCIVDAILLRSRHPAIRFEMVKGNVDTGNERPSECFAVIDSIPVLITHGDLYQVEIGLDTIVKAGKAAGARLILHGHTHLPCIASIDGIMVMNPGRIGRISSKKINASFGVIETNQGNICCSILFVDSLNNNA